jgi:hypothetical protein
VHVANKSKGRPISGRPPSPHSRTVCVRYGFAGFRIVPLLPPDEPPGLPIGPLVPPVPLVAPVSVGLPLRDVSVPVEVPVPDEPEPAEPAPVEVSGPGGELVPEPPMFVVPEPGDAVVPGAALPAPLACASTGESIATAPD